MHMTSGNAGAERQTILITSRDLRETANRHCSAAQKELE
jgi:hypothetical protein